jgi:hypothetical protein
MKYLALSLILLGCTAAPPAGPATREPTTPVIQEPAPEPVPAPAPDASPALPADAGAPPDTMPTLPPDASPALAPDATPAGPAELPPGWYSECDPMITTSQNPCAGRTNYAFRCDWACSQSTTLEYAGSGAATCEPVNYVGVGRRFARPGETCGGGSPPCDYGLLCYSTGMTVTRPTAEGDVLTGAGVCRKLCLGDYHCGGARCVHADLPCARHSTTRYGEPPQAIAGIGLCEDPGPP